MNLLADRATSTFDDISRETNLTTAVDSTGSTLFGFDALNRQISQVDITSYFTFTHTFGYDVASQRTSKVLPTGEVITYTFDLDGRSSTFRDTENKVTSIQYDARGLRTTVTFATERVQTSRFDADGRQIGQKDVLGSTLQLFTYTFDPNGNLATTQELGLVLTTNTFDDKDRLTESVQYIDKDLNYKYNYSFDTRDNLAMNTETGARVTNTYDAASRLTTSISGSSVTTYTFDANGNMTNIAEPGGGLTTITHDKENRVKSRVVDTDTDFLTYRFDGKLRYQLPANSTNRTWVWVGDDMSFARSTSDSAEDWIIYSADGVIYSEKNSYQDRWDYLVDFLGSVTGYSTTVGSSNVRYTPYGTPLSGPPATLFTWTGNTGSLFLDLAFLEHYNRARIVSTLTKQWVTRDPIWPEEKAYGYVTGNPVTWIDPSGLSVAQVFWACMQQLETGGGMTRRQRCEVCKKESGSRVRCDGDCFAPGPNDPEDCSARFKKNWKVAFEGCMQVCGLYVCAGLKGPLKKACMKMCEVNCRDATGGGRGPVWGVCQKQESEGSCHDCCNKLCGSRWMCTEQCQTSCCGDKS